MLLFFFKKQPGVGWGNAWPGTSHRCEQRLRFGGGAGGGSGPRCSVGGCFLVWSWKLKRKKEEEKKKVVVVLLSLNLKLNLVSW